jgi:DNA modification methylase
MTVTVLQGDCRDVLKTLPDESVHCVVTSPPYWGLRDYGVEGQIGLEQSLSEHLTIMVDLFRDVRRVLKPAGTLWLNYGDCYATTSAGVAAGPNLVNSAANANRNKNSKAKESYRPDAGNRIRAGGNLKSGDLCMIPNRLAIALQDDGWWVKAENIWGKTNPMPDSSGAIRPSSAHEKIWLLAKSNVCEYYRARDTGEIATNPDTSEMVAMVTTGQLGPRWIRLPYYFDAVSVKQGRTSDEDAITFRGGSYVEGEPGKRQVVGNKRIKMPDGWDTGPGGHGSHHRNGREAGKTIDKQRGHSRRHQGFNDRWDQMEKAEQIANGRFLRNFEPAPLTIWPMATQAFSDAHFATFPPELAERCIKAGCPKDGTVLDPFGGAGTTGLVADRLGRNAILIELNPEYAAMAERRIKRDAGMFADVIGAAP